MANLRPWPKRLKREQWCASRQCQAVSAGVIVVMSAVSFVCGALKRRWTARVHVWCSVLCGVMVVSRGGVHLTDAFFLLARGRCVKESRRGIIVWCLNVDVGRGTTSRVLCRCGSEWRSHVWGKRCETTPERRDHDELFFSESLLSDAQDTKSLTQSCHDKDMKDLRHPLIIIPHCPMSPLPTIPMAIMNQDHLTIRHIPSSTHHSITAPRPHNDKTHDHPHRATK